MTQVLTREELREMAGDAARWLHDLASLKDNVHRAGESIRTRVTAAQALLQTWAKIAPSKYEDPAELKPGELADAVRALLATPEGREELERQGWGKR